MLPCDLENSPSLSGILCGGNQLYLNTVYAVDAIDEENENEDKTNF